MTIMKIIIYGLFVCLVGYMPLPSASFNEIRVFSMMEKTRAEKYK